MISQREIIAYYENCEVDYRLVWHLDSHMAMHYGLWHPGVKSLRGALRRQNDFMAKLAGITADDHVLDAGCGVGGSSVHLASNIGARVTGITLSERQRSRCEHNAQRAGVAERCVFHCRDYTASQFPDNHFDVVWAIESVCHANEKADFLKEACRVLKPDGRLCIADFFRVPVERGTPEDQLLLSWAKGWAVPDFEEKDLFLRKTKTAGFEDIVCHDETEDIYRTARRLYLCWFPGVVVNWVCETLRLRDKVQAENVHAARYQYKALKQGLWTYNLITARKGERS